MLKDARAWRGQRLPRLFFLGRIGCSADGTGSGLGLCVIHKPHAGYRHREDEQAGYEQQRSHLEWRRRTA
jgi:hypothetical protein